MISTRSGVGGRTARRRRCVGRLIARLQRVAERRIIGYHERLQARHPTEGESTTLNLSPLESVLVFDRTTRTTTMILATLSLTARGDRFEVDYLIDA